MYLVVSAMFYTVTNMAPFMPFRMILVIEWQHNTWTNMIVKMIILSLLGSSDDKEREDRHSKARRTDTMGIGASDGSRKNRRHGTLVQKRVEAKSAYRHRLNRRSKKGHRCIGCTVFQRQCQACSNQAFSTGWTGAASEQGIRVMTSAEEKEANG